MKPSDPLYRVYVDVLKQELIPAMGCTEPIAIAYACAIARDTLGDLPTRVTLAISNNIIKNVKSVVVPNTGGRKGIGAAVAVGFIAGVAKKELQVISQVSDGQRDEIGQFLETCKIDISAAKSSELFDIQVKASSDDHQVNVRITGSHTNLVLIERDGKVLHASQAVEKEKAVDTRGLSVEKIVAFADIVDLADISDLIGTQIKYNMAISEEGLTGKWGAAIGKTLLDTQGTHIKVRARARAAAASDARMGGCELPVIINSGSGNQGLTASLPVIEYANELGSSKEDLYRALVVSNLLTIHLKTGIGALSAYCGVVSAGCAAGAAVSYLHGGDCKTVSHALVNSLANISGVICDGAKASCAAKIASAIEAGLLGWQMYENGQQFYAGDGIVRKGVEETIKMVARVGRDGMYETDREIINIMTEE